MLEELEKALNYNFKNKEIFKNALTHKSYNEGLQKNLPDNEKLEFLGDSVINLVITEYLYRTYKDWNEGELSKLKSHLVSSNFLSNIAMSINLGNYILLGKGEEKNQGRDNKKINSSLFEAVIGAIYIDSNYKVISSIIISFFKDFFKSITEKAIRINDYKSELQEIVQEKNNSLPYYRTIKESGKPPNILFTAAVYIDNKEIGSGKGKNKRQAEQDAALNALDKINKLKNYEKLSEVFFVKR
ncbi:MAG: ribonuclease III [Candidatus Aminicenantes bacterium]|nr:ribonuclease III [Candidatus Aminicenantes bacterium]